jgi:hypothetical protein
VPVHSPRKAAVVKDDTPRRRVAARAPRASRRLPVVRARPATAPASPARARATRVDDSRVRIESFDSNRDARWTDATRDATTTTPTASKRWTR